MPTLADLKAESCRSCGAAVYWLRNDNTGKMAPIDTKQDPDGPIILRADGGNILYHVLTKIEIGEGLGDGISRYSNHFQTCPYANQHKKRG